MTSVKKHQRSITFVTLILVFLNGSYFSRSIFVEAYMMILTERTELFTSQTTIKQWQIIEKIQDVVMNDIELIISKCSLVLKQNRSSTSFRYQISTFRLQLNEAWPGNLQEKGPYRENHVNSTVGGGQRRNFHLRKKMLFLV